MAAVTLVTDPPPVDVEKFPYPYQAAFTVASDIDSGSLLRFRAVHSLFGGQGVIGAHDAEWHALGLTDASPRYDQQRGGVVGLGLGLADSFFLVGDPTTFGMYRYWEEAGCFLEDEEAGENCADLIRQWLKHGQIDSFHAFLHYTRRQVEPLLKGFYTWCERENVAKPKVWINHSAGVTPSGLCPDWLQPNPIYRLARLSARYAVGPAFGRRRQPLSHAFVRYQGAKPGSPYYINDLLVANDLRYVWLNINDLHRDRIALPEELQNGRSTILRPVTMDDGVRYWRFERCYGGPPGTMRGLSYLRESSEGFDASHLISEKNLDQLCRLNGTCILGTHWTHFRSVPLANETIARFDLLRAWRDLGKIWITSTSQLLEWTRLRTFLKIACHREGRHLIIDIQGVEDPIFGSEPVRLKDVAGLAFRLRQPELSVIVAIQGQPLSPECLVHTDKLCWVQPAEAEQPALPCALTLPLNRTVPR